MKVSNTNSFRVARLLIVDDDPVFRARVREAMTDVYELDEAGSEAEFWQLYAPSRYDLLLLDVRLREAAEGLDLLRRLRIYDEAPPVVMISAYTNTELIHDTLGFGALAYLSKQEFSAEMIMRMISALLREADYRRKLRIVQRRDSDAIAELLGADPGMVRLRRQIVVAAGTPHAVVLISGEPGTGRRLAARHIHATTSDRDAHTFAILPLAGKSRDAARLELLGDSGRRGLLLEATGGMLVVDATEAFAPAIIDEILDLLGSPELKIPGLTATIRCDIQLVIVATPDQNLGRTLAHRLQQLKLAKPLIEIGLPALRERRGDIPLLAGFFIQSVHQRHLRTRPAALSPDSVAMLEDYAWPGNVAELKAACESAAYAASTAQSLLPAHFASYVTRREWRRTPTLNYEVEIAKAELNLVETALIEHGRLQKNELYRMLGYNDRFALQRRITKLLSTHKDLAADFKRTSELFGFSQAQ
jgi:two-component system, NtrC family, response regulator AtoC